MTRTCARFIYRPVPEWGPFAWCARYSRNGGPPTVFHGPAVETAAEWFCEAVWDGEFAAGDLDRTDLVAGTGGRIRGDTIIFASSGHSVDRLVSLECNGILHVSNSLGALLACTGAALDPTYPRYQQDFATVTRGLSQYKSTIDSSRGPITITYFGDIRCRGPEIVRDLKPFVRRDFSTFARYLAFLRERLAAVAANARAPGRRRPLALLSTLSSGYDSAAVSALAREVGCGEALCVSHDRRGDPENGAAIARLLGLQPNVVDRNAWRSRDAPEIPFLASDGNAHDVFLAAAAPQLEGRLLLTGFYGDWVWGKSPTDLSGDLVRGVGGLSMAEFRLLVGFVHCPVPYWGSRQIRDVNAISNSDEMRPWDVPGPYSRPICRRIVETAGVPRELFGVSKRMVAVGLRHFLTPGSLAEYRRWLAANRWQWIRHGKLPPLTSPRAHRVIHRLEEWLELLARTDAPPGRTARGRPAGSGTTFARYAFPWAAERLAGRYAAGLAGIEPR